MDLSAIDPILFFASLMVAATPILLAGIGELVVERAGVLNLGVEGMMILGAVCGFVVAVNTGSAGLASSAAFGALSLPSVWRLDPNTFVKSGCDRAGTDPFGLGLSALIGQSHIGIKGPEFADIHIPLLGDIPVPDQSRSNTTPWLTLAC